MIDIIDVMQSVAVFTCAIVGYVLVFQKSGHKKVGHYSLPGELFGIKISNVHSWSGLLVVYVLAIPDPK